MQIAGYDIGVCGWSLQPKDTADLIARVKSLELEDVQLGLTSLLAKDDAGRSADIELLRKSGLKISATSISFPGEDYATIGTIQRTGGFVADEAWPQRKEMAIRAAQLTADLGVRYLEFHMGFVPASSDPHYNLLVERVREVAAAFAKVNVDLLMETGQESASELLQFLNDLNCRNAAVNFDPANMILYGTGDPIEAVTILNRHIRHVHLKDAIASSQPRLQWGKEVPLGSGEVGIERLLEALDEINFGGVLAIERESGSDRMGDIRAAIQILRRVEG